MSSDPRIKPKKMMGARVSSSKKPTGQRKPPQTDPPPGAKAATTIAAKALPQRQPRKSAAQPSASSTTASPNKPRPTTARPSRQNHFVLTHKATESDILCKALQKYPEKNKPPDQTRWFDSYDSLDRKLSVEHGRNKPYDKTILAQLEILIREQNGNQHHVGLQDAVRDTISYLLDVEAEGNPVTAITSLPRGVSKPLWKGRLYLGGIKDSGNVKGVLERLDIDAVVSIHPTDWLTDECWKDLFEKWDWNLDPKGNSLRSRPRNSKRMQCHIELADESSSDLLGYFRRAFEFMDEFLIIQGKNVLVHCKMGQSRSASLSLGYMMDRYYRTYFANLDRDRRPPADKISAELQGVMKVFLGEFALPRDSDEPAGSAPPRSTTRKRKGVSTDKFMGQLVQYAQYLAEGEKGQPPRPAKAAQKKAGGGIIKGAAVVLCFMCSFTPTREILGYWSDLKGETTHYWEAASRDKALKEGIRVTNHMAMFNRFFEDQRNPSPDRQKTPPA